jgi:hypothetical protein
MNVKITIERKIILSLFIKKKLLYDLKPMFALLKILLHGKKNVQNNRN